MPPLESGCGRRAHADREGPSNRERDRHIGTITMMTSSWPSAHTDRHRHRHRCRHRHKHRHRHRHKRLCTHRQIALVHTADQYTGTHTGTETHIHTQAQKERGRVYVCMGLGAYLSVVSSGRRGSMKASSTRAPSLPMLLFHRLCQGGQAPQSATRDSRYGRSHTHRDRERERE
jgi:hypothetical protein